MRVAIDCRYIRARPSGIGAYVQALVDRLPALAPEDHFHWWAHPQAPRPLSRAVNTSQTLVRAAANSPATLLWPARLASLRSVDVLHAPFNILGRGIPVPTVVTVHDLMWLETPELCEQPGWRRSVRARFYGAGLRRALRHATRIVAISQATADAIARVRPQAQARVRVIHHGVEKRFAPPRDAVATRGRCTALLGDERPFFLVMGQHAPYKNHEKMLRAFAASGLAAHVKLVLVQRLSATHPIRDAIARLGLTSAVCAFGELTGEDALALMQSALALVQFSQQEGFGMPVLEAMACGTPVIASDISVLREVVAGAGVLVPLDEGALAATMQTLSADEARRRRLKATGLERARAFCWQRSAEQHLAVYREAAEQRRIG